MKPSQITVNGLGSTLVFSFIFLLTLWVPASDGFAASADLPAVATNIVIHEESFWHACTKGSTSITSRDLFAYALALCEAREHPERLDRLFELAAQMQDQNPKSRSFGNFWWSLRDGKVMDYNAVDFSMRGGALLWLKHRDFIPAAAQEHLQVLLDFAVQGCLHHRVEPSYSNIAIMNAGDLILLGEALGQPAVADEGYTRLDRIFRYTQAVGIHEFNSPTYTGVDLDGLGMIEAFGKRGAGRAQARALLNFWWTDIALNWFPPAQKLAGANSRTYDYPRGLGELDRQLALNGWLEAPAPTELDAVFSLQADWHPPEAIPNLSRQFPRLVRESWGTNWWQSRTHYLLPDITLSCTASSYGGRMDMPLTADLPGDRKSTRCYFIADGRNDPYGKMPVAAGAHRKAFHLNPFWTAAQRKGDVLGLVIYRHADLETNTTTLVSDFVMPTNVDSLWIGGRRITFQETESFREQIGPDELISFRKGEAVLGIRVPWSRALDGHAAPIFLIRDNNAFGAMRVAVEHVAPGQPPVFTSNTAGATFWIRVGNGIKSEADFAAWREQFENSQIQFNATLDDLQLAASGNDGPISLSARAPWTAPESITPVPTRSALALDGDDISQRILTTPSQP